MHNNTSILCVPSLSRPTRRGCPHLSFFLPNRKFPFSVCMWLCVCRCVPTVLLMNLQTSQLQKYVPRKNKNRKEGCRGGSQYTPPATILHKYTIHTYTSTHTTPPFVWQGETRPVVPSANPSGARPVPLDPLDRILVWAVVAGWSHCVTLALSLTQYRYVPCGPDYQGTM